MSVDYYQCDCCEESRYEEYISRCEDCGRRLCINCAAPEDEYGQHDSFDPFMNNDGYIKKEHCPFCSGELVHNDDLLQFLLDEYVGVSREEAVILYKKMKGVKR